MGLGNLYVGTVDGRLIAIDIKTGKPVWDTKLVNSQELSRRGGQAHHDPRLMSCS